MRKLKYIVVLSVVISIVSGLLVFPGFAHASFESESLKINKDFTLNYWLFTPENTTENMPLVVYLHGRNEKGEDINKLKEDGFCKWVSEGKFDNVPAFMVFPQLPSDRIGWESMRGSIKQLVDVLSKQYPIDTNNISLTGHSMGGAGTFSLATSFPQMFSRIAPMSGFVNDTETAKESLNNTPIWAFVGSADDIIEPENSIDFINSIKETNPNAKITVFDNATHFDVPELAFLDEELDVVGWLIGNSDNSPNGRVVGFDDIKGLECEDEVNALAEMGIITGMSDDTYAPNSTLTRAQMATILVRAFEKEYVADEIVFDDVPQSHWAYSYIKQATAMGYVNGITDTLYDPESSVTLEQCVTMLVRALGLGDKAELDGGYPDGYMQMGGKYNLLKNVTEEQGENALTRADMAILVYNSKTADIDDGMNMYSNSDFIEKEQPELTEETKALISEYQKNPTEENYLKLRDMVIDNYNAVLDRKETKLAELKEETKGKPGGDAIVAEMEELVNDMYLTYWIRINSSMLRFSDTRLLKWRIADAPKYEYIPVMGAGETIYVSRTPVTNQEYAKYIKETSAIAPSNWVNGTYPEGEENYPVNFVSYDDAMAYCDWLTEKDGVNTYRLPSESEWELAAGHMPKDADFNCGVNDGRTPVEQYASVTRGAHGAVDFWGNVWEWTSTLRANSNSSSKKMAIKGGSWKSPRTDCRTEYRKGERISSSGYDDVGFRVIKVLNGKEPLEKKEELMTLDEPVVSATNNADNSVTLSWQAVDKAVEYQIFEYFEETGLVKMLDRADATSITFENVSSGTHHYIVQPISYTAICDNVYAENAISVACK